MAKEDYASCKDHGLSDVDISLMIIAAQKKTGNLRKDMYFDMLTAFAGAEEFSSLAIGEYFACIYNPNFDGNINADKKVLSNVDKLIAQKDKSAFDSLALAAYYYYQTIIAVKGINRKENLESSVKELQNAEGLLHGEAKIGQNPVSALIYLNAAKRFSLNDVSTETNTPVFPQDLPCTGIIYNYYCKKPNNNGVSEDVLANFVWALKGDTVSEREAKIKVSSYALPETAVKTIQSYWKSLGRSGDGY